jgi:hypothetical protein
MSGNTGFQFKYNLAGRTSGIQRSFIIANSATIAIGDMVSLTSGFVALSGAGASIMGVVVGLTDRLGIDLDNSQITKEGTYSSTNKAYTVDSDNQTSEKARAVIDIDPFSVYSATPDATLGTDDQSDLAGCYTDIVAASDQPDEDTAATTQCQLFIWGVDPENSANGLYSIAQHQLWGWTIV